MSTSYLPPQDGDPELQTLRVENQVLRRGFTLIPNVVLRAHGISRDAKLLYGILLSYAWQTGSCFPGYETLQADLQCGSAQVAKYLGELKATGLISAKRRGQGKTSIYVIHDPSDAKDQNTQTERTSSFSLKEQELPKWKAEEYTVEEDPEEKDAVISKASAPTQSDPQGLAPSKFRKGSRQEFLDQERGETPYSEPAPTPTAGGMTRISEVLQAKGVGRTRTTDTRRQAAALNQQPAPTASEDHRTAPPMSTGERTAAQRSVHGQVTPEERQAIQGYLGDFAPELGDQAPFQSSVSRACNIYTESSLTLSAFIQRLYSARSRTKERSTSIRSPSKRFAYFLALLEEECGLREPPAAIAAAAKARTRTERAEPAEERPRGRRSLAGQYAHLVRGAEDDEDDAGDTRQSMPSEPLSGPRKARNAPRGLSG